MRHFTQNYSTNKTKIWNWEMTHTCKRKQKNKSYITIQIKQQTESQGERNNVDTEQPENKRLNGYNKYSHINNHTKFKWTELTNQKA